jgi:hypothetical protein
MRSYSFACSCTEDHGVSYNYQDLFLRSFSQELSQILAKRILEFLNDSVKRSMYAIKDFPIRNVFFLNHNALCNIHCSLKLLLETKIANQVVEFIIEESTVNETLYDRYFAPWQKEWMDIILCIVKEVIERRSVLITSI